MSRICYSYLSANNSLGLEPAECSLLYRLNSSQAGEIINHVNTQTNRWIKVSRKIIKQSVSNIKLWKITTICNALPSLLVDSFMGGWCDLFGKRLPMFLPAVGGVLSSIVYILVVSFDTLGVEWLCLASFLSGICGGVTSVIANCFSYVAAVTDSESRTLRVSVVEGMMFVAATLGPFLSELMKTKLGLVFVFSGRNY